jgi:hypothetical protein
MTPGALSFPALRVNWMQLVRSPPPPPLLPLPAKVVMTPSSTDTARMRFLYASPTYTVLPSGDTATPYGEKNRAEADVPCMSKFSLCWARAPVVVLGLGGWWWG